MPLWRFARVFSLLELGEGVIDGSKPKRACYLAPAHPRFMHHGANLHSSGGGQLNCVGSSLVSYEQLCASLALRPRGFLVQADSYTQAPLGSLLPRKPTLMGSFLVGRS